MADKSIATNQSYKRVAVERGSMDPEDVVVVRSAPDIDYFDQLRNHVERRETESVKVGYVGVMGEQEGLDLLLEAVKIVREHRRDIQFTLIGDGPAAADVKALARQYNLHDVVEFTGRISDRAMISELAGADICVNPDRATPMNDKSTMNKIMEYMALGKPIVQFDRTEGRFSAGEASLYARKDDPEDFAKKIMVLADDPDRRQKMGRKGRRRLEEQLSWKHQKDALLALYRELLN